MNICASALKSANCQLQMYKLAHVCRVPDVVI